MQTFTPLSALAGGALIGLAAALLWLGAGRIAGISGIVAGLLTPRREGTLWRAAFVVGLLAAAPLYVLTGGPVRDLATPAPLAVVILAGGLVGFGARLGGGCTSGHGVCGLGRLSPRSLAATGVFMSTAAATVFVVRHVLDA